MPKDLNRMMALDAALASEEGLQINRYTRKQRISLRTARRDIRRLRRMGQTIDVYEYDDGTTRFHYARGVDPLFSCNIQRKRKTR